MNKDLFEKFRELNLPIGKYAIFGSGPMGIRGLKECNDIDAIVLSDIFEEYKNKPEWKFEENKGWGNGLLEYMNIELLRNWGPGTWNVQEIINEADIIDGLAFVKLDKVLEWKKIMNREKDKKDIEIIEGYLKRE